MTSLHADEAFLDHYQLSHDPFAPRVPGFKFFPAQQAGGVGMLKAFHGPFADARFCPTGGITFDTAANFLALPNVACVGGSWLAPVSAVRAGDWERITQLARDTLSLGGTLTA